MLSRVATTEHGTSKGEGKGKGSSSGEVKNTAPEKSLLDQGVDQANGHRVYLGRKPTYNREQLARVMDLLDHESDITIAREVGLDRLAVRRVRQDPARAEAALVAWEDLKARPRRHTKARNA
jgi:hypothetical protein